MLDVLLDENGRRVRAEAAGMEAPPDRGFKKGLMLVRNADDITAGISDIARLNLEGRLSYRGSAAPGSGRASAAGAD